MRYRFVAAALALGLCTAVGSADPSMAFPVIKGKDLTGKRVSTESFRGKPWVVMVGFERSQAKAMEEWAVRFKESFPNEDRADYFQIAAMPGNVEFMAGFIRKQMSRAVPPMARNRVMTVFDAGAIARKLEIRERERVHVFVLDAEGKVVHRESGAFREAAFGPIRQKLRELGAG